MNTIFKKLVENAQAENDQIIQEAAKIIISGGLVAFPTETVYGLGANALDKNASMKIYEAKGRPSDNPLIAHICDLEMLKELVMDISQDAEKLIEAYWPGPMTLIFKKKNIIPMEITGGLDTVAIRMPNNPYALDLIRESKTPIAAPSANLSGTPSPTTAKHVQEDLDGRVDMIIDGGDSAFGLESTIIDVSGENIEILRPGAITWEMVNHVIRNVAKESAGGFSGSTPKAPGMKYKHYSPKATVTIVSGESRCVSERIRELMEKDNKKSVIFTTAENIGNYQDESLFIMGESKNPMTIAKNIFSLLRKADEESYENIFIEAIDEKDIGVAVMNRLKKASNHNIIYV